MDIEIFSFLFTVTSCQNCLCIFFACFSRKEMFEKMCSHLDHRTHVQYSLVRKGGFCAPSEINF